MEGVLVTGTATAELEGECGRCLEPIEDEITVAAPGAVRLRRAARQGAEHHDRDLDDEISQLEDDLLDLEPLLRDAVVLALPFQPLCREDCPGLCVECGARLADDPDHAHEAPIDPRWAGLDQLDARPETDHRLTGRDVPGRGDSQQHQERTMAVPKRKMSRSNTRHRRSQWKAVAPILVTCANPACAAKHLPHRACGAVRPVRRPRRPSPGPLTEPSNSAEHQELREALGDPVLDPGLLDRALTHRSFAYENGQIPTNERLEFLGDSVLGVVVTETLYTSPPRPLRGAAGQAARGGRQRPRPGRRGPRDRPRPAHQARPRRGDDRRSRQGLDPLRHRRGRHRRDPPERRHRGVAATRGPPALRPGDGGRRLHGRRPRLEDLPAGALRRPRPRCSRVRHRGRRPRPHEDLRRPRPRRRAAATATAPAARRRRPSRAPPRPPTSSSAARQPRPKPDPDPCPVPELPEVEVVRAGLARHVTGATHRRRRGAPPAPAPA